jgi:polyhydroxyalkanoate synthesis regulator phasin
MADARATAEEADALRTHVADLQSELAAAQTAAAAGAGAAAELEDARSKLAALQQVCFDRES